MSSQLILPDDEPTTSAPPRSLRLPDEEPAPTQLRLPDEVEEREPSREFAKRVARTDAVSHHAVATPEELRAIAQRNGVDEEWLRGMAAWYRQRPAKDTEDAKSFFPGSVGDYVKEGVAGIDEALTGGMVRGALIKPSDLTPEQQRALDDVRALADEKRPDWIDVAEFGGGLAAGIFTGAPIARAGLAAAKSAGLSAKATKVAGGATALATAAAGGALGSEYGEEVGGAIYGLLAVLGLTGAAKAIGYGARKLSQKAGDSLVGDVVAAVDASDALPAARAAKEAARDSEEALARVVVGEAKKSPARGWRQFLAETTPAERSEIAKLYQQSDEVSEFAKRERDPTNKRLEQAARTVLGIDDDQVSTAWKAFAVARRTHEQLGEVGRVGNIRTRSVGEYTEREGAQFVRGQLDRIREAEYLTTQLSKVIDSVQTEEMGKLRKAWVHIADARYVYDALDSRYGTTTARSLDKLSNAHNAYTVAVAAAAKRLESVRKSTLKAEKTTKLGEDFREAAYDALDRGEFDPARFTEGQIASLREWKSAYNDLADQIEAAHEAFPDLKLSKISVPRKLSGPEESYVPHYVKELREFVPEVESRMAKLDPAARKSLVDRAQAWRELGDEAKLADSEGRAAHDLLLAHEIYSGQSIGSAAALDEVAKAMRRGEKAGESMSTQAASLFERRGDIPEWLLERDLSKLALRWTHSIYRHAFMRDGLDELARTGSVIRRFSPVLGQYVDNHVRDLAGSRKDTWANWAQSSWTRVQLDLERRARATDSAVARSTLRVVADLDDTLRKASNNMYSYFLGARPDAAFRNLVQPLVMTGAQIGGPYGYRVAAKGYATSWANRKVAVDEMKRMGQLPDDQLFEAVKTLREGLVEGGLVGRGKEGLDRLASVSLLMYRFADTNNRVATRRMAEIVFEDLAAGSADARRALEMVSPGYRTEIVSLMKAGKMDDAKRAYTDFLLGSTQFNYNRVSLSEFGRAMGWMFSMFSKWPASMVGELGGAIDAKSRGQFRGETDGLRLFQKYAIPLLVTQTAQKAWWEEEREESPGAAAFLGRDLAQWSPTSAIPVGVDEVLRIPPVIDLAGKVFSSSSPEAAAANAIDLGLAGTPGGIWLRTALEYIPEWTGEAKKTSPGKEMIGVGE